MSHPVGTDFVPTLAHRELCKPKVQTAVGAIIAPISKDMVCHKYTGDPVHITQKYTSNYRDLVIAITNMMYIYTCT